MSLILRPSRVLVPSKRWNPSQISSPALWCCGEFATSTFMEDASVAGWQSLVAGSYTASQATGAKQPTMKRRAINGMPGLSFTNAAASQLGFGSNWTTIVSSTTYAAWIVLVVDSIATNFDDVSPYSNVGVLNDGNNNYQGVYLRANGGAPNQRAQSYYYKGSATCQSIQIPAFGTPFLYRMRHISTGVDATSTVTARVNNGTEISTANAWASAGGAGAMQIGAGQGGSITARIADIIIGNNPTQSDFDLVDTYVNARYALW